MALNGRGRVVDWLVVMRRFDQDRLFDRMAVEGRLTEPMMDQLGIEIARFHGHAQITPSFGGLPDLKEEIEKPSGNVSLSVYSRHRDSRRDCSRFKAPAGVLDRLHRRSPP
ncbi:hypothetical protein THH46_14670 [Pseudomonas sp. NA13]